VADDAFADAVTTIANQLASMPTKALVRTRQAMLAAHTHSLEQQLSYEALLMRELGRSADYVEGVTAFLEKRPAQFTGQ
jgi:2-(1,2-epoxy-1,2-dihydrophenyl)acetyl-CoA isomerase